MYEYDLQGRLTRLRNRLPGNVNVAEFTYDYDYNWETGAWTMLGQRTSMTVDAAAAAAQTIGTTKYWYDATYQLIRADYPGGFSDAWQYDAIGNRTQANLGGAVTNYTYFRYPANPNENSSRLQSAGNASYTYDDNGNAITTSNGTLTWDDRNQLRQYGNDIYEYDPLGRRTKAGASTAPSTFVYEGLNPVVIRNTALGRRDTYVFGPGIDEPLARHTAAGTIQYLAVDGLGSIIAGVTGTAVTAGTSYRPFGSPPLSTPAHFGYTGREPSGQEYYYRARYYEPGTGRFISEDPLRWFGDPHPYAYARSQPVSSKDPFGLVTESSKPEVGKPYCDFGICTPPICPPSKKCTSQTLNTCMKNCFATWSGPYYAALFRASWESPARSREWLATFITSRWLNFAHFIARYTAVFRRVRFEWLEHRDARRVEERMHTAANHRFGSTRLRAMGVRLSPFACGRSDGDPTLAARSSRAPVSGWMSEFVDAAPGPTTYPGGRAP